MRTNFKFEDKYITMTRGDTLAFGVEIKDQDGNPLDIDSADMTCKKKTTDEYNIFHKALGSGISKVEDGIYRVRVAPEDTKFAEVGKYFYDLQVGIGTDVFTLLKGVLELEQDVTH